MNFKQLNDLTKKFLITEGNTRTSSIRAYLMALRESLERMNPSTAKDKRNLTLAVDHLKEVRRGVRKLEEEVKLLQEQVRILEENKGNSIIDEK